MVTEAAIGDVFNAKNDTKGEEGKRTNRTQRQEKKKILIDLLGKSINDNNSRNANKSKI